MVRGSVAYLYAFDVGSEILTGRVGPALARPVAGVAGWRTQTVPKGFVFPAPLTTGLSPDALTVAGLPAEAAVRAYEVGVVTVTVRVTGVAGDLADWRTFHHPTTGDGRPLDEAARELCRRASGLLGAAVRGPVPVGQPEAYTAFCLYDLDGEADATRWLEANRRAAAGLLNDLDPDRTSEAQLAETFRFRRSFEVGDLVVVDWDAALVVDLSGFCDDVLFVFELANLQLEELQVLDAALDRHLDRAYDHLARRPGLWPGRWATVLRELRRLRVDASALADGVTNITKFVGDWYLARVYLGTRGRFHLDDWQASVDQRVAQLDRVYELIHGEVTERHMFVLEVMVVALIAIELVAAIVRR